MFYSMALTLLGEYASIRRSAPHTVRVDVQKSGSARLLIVAGNPPSAPIDYLRIVHRSKCGMFVLVKCGQGFCLDSWAERGILGILPDRRLSKSTGSQRPSWGRIATGRSKLSANTSHFPAARKLRNIEVTSATEVEIGRYELIDSR
jgi:hypothetical protein